MKLSARDATRFVSHPDVSLCGALIYGEDGVEVARRRAKLTSLLSEDDDLRRTQLSAADVRKDNAALLDAIKARGFFSGRQVIVISDGGDGLTKAIQDALSEATSDDAFLIVTAGILPARSKLRKLFETSKNAVAAPCYANAMDRETLRDRLREAGSTEIADDALGELEQIAKGLDSGAVADFVARLSLYTLDENGPIRTDHVLACAPRMADAELDEALDAVADGNAAAIGPLLSKLSAQGQTATGLAIAAGKYFRRLHALAAAGQAGASVDVAIGGLRPPVFGPRRDALARRSRKWPLGAVENAMSLILEADDALRGGSNTAGFAVLERTLLRIALTARRG